MTLVEHNVAQQEKTRSFSGMQSTAPPFTPHDQTSIAQAAKDVPYYDMYHYHTPPPFFYPNVMPPHYQTFSEFHAPMYPNHNGSTYCGVPASFQLPLHALPYRPYQGAGPVGAYNGYRNEQKYVGNAKDVHSSWQGSPISPGSPMGSPWFQDSFDMSKTMHSQHTRSRNGSNVASTATPRGPPQKPRQSGHALWVGNLPPNTDIMDLKNHFAKGAKTDIESLKLISKSGCAFVNYRSQAACSEAMVRFHGVEFFQTKLVCRLRKKEATAEVKRPLSLNIVPANDSIGQETSTNLQSPASSAENQRLRARYFVLKSMTLEDLDLSVQNEMWATQAHNEDALNGAFHSADDVYLFFSANRSGEYYGCAKMTGPIRSNDHSVVKEELSAEGGRRASADIESSSATGIQITVTPATQDAPAGRIVYDQARDTLFWEATDDETSMSASSDESGGKGPQIVNGSNTSVQPGLDRSSSEESEGSSFEPSLNRSFGVHWISRQSVPFYKTRSLRNSWNANRAVKIARDGTELDPDVGQKLFSLFFPHGEPGRA